MKILKWLRRNRVAEAMPDHDAHERFERLFARGITARFESVYPDSSIPDTTRWPDLCVPGDPCGVKFSNEADRGEWYDCPNHKPKGRHRIRPAIYAVVTDIDE